MQIMCHLHLPMLVQSLFLDINLLYTLVHLCIQTAIIVLFDVEASAK